MSLQRSEVRVLGPLTNAHRTLDTDLSLVQLFFKWISWENEYVPFWLFFFAMMYPRKTVHFYTPKTVKEKKKKRRKRKKKKKKIASQICLSRCSNKGSKCDSFHFEFFFLEMPTRFRPVLHLVRVSSRFFTDLIQICERGEEKKNIRGKRLSFATQARQIKRFHSGL